jgi:hypothetical protein
MDQITAHSYPCIPLSLSMNWTAATRSGGQNRRKIGGQERSTLFSSKVWVPVSKYHSFVDRESGVGSIHRAADLRVVSVDVAGKDALYRDEVILVAPARSLSVSKRTAAFEQQSLMWPNSWVSSITFLISPSFSFCRSFCRSFYSRYRG